MTEFQKLPNNFHKHKWVSEHTDMLDPITCFEWSLNGNFALTGDFKGKVHTVELSSGIPSISDSLPVCSSRITDVSLNRSGDIFASTSVGSSKVVLGSCSDTNFGSKTVSFPNPSQPLCVSFMQDEVNGQNLLLIGDRNGIRLVDAQSGALFREMTHNGGATSLHSWNGCMVAGGSADGTVSLWDARSKQPIAHFGNRNTNKKCVFSVDAAARVLAVAGSNGTVQLFDISSRKKIVEKKILEQDVKCLAFSPSFRFLLAADKTKPALINLNEISLGAKPLPTTTIVDLASVTGVRWHPKNCLFISRSTDRRIRLFRPILEE